MSNIELVYHPLIIPSVVIPFTAVLAALSALATFIAGLFGLQLHAEGPKKLLEVLLKPRVLGAALITNLLFLGGYAGYHYGKNYPVMLWRVEQKQKELSRSSSLSYPESENISQPLTISAQPGTVSLDWTQQLEAGSFRGAVVSGDALFLGTDSGLVHELDPKNGVTRRSFFVGTAVSPQPVISNGAIFVGEGLHDTHHARIYKFDLATGAFSGAFGSKGHIEAEPAIGRAGDKTVIVVPAGADGIRAADTSNLAELWHAQDGHVDGAPLIEAGVVYSGTGIEKENPGKLKGSANAYDLLTGKRLWRRELPASSWMRPLVFEEKVCFVFGEIYFASDLGGMYCFRKKDGAPDIAYNHAAPLAAKPMLVASDVIVSDVHGKLCRVSLSDGLRRWCRETGEAKLALANPVLDSKRGVLLYPSQKEGLFILNPANGEVLGRWKAEGEKLGWSKSFAPVAVLPDGWIVVDMKGVVRKLRWNEESRSAALSR